MIVLKNKRILIISPEAWGNSHVSKHHYAITLAKRNNQVYFLSPAKDNIENSIEAKPHPDHKNLTLINYHPILKGKSRLPRFVKDFLNKLEINKLSKVWSQLDIVWSFDPFRFQRLSDFNAKLKIYHPVDVHNTPLEIQIANYFWNFRSFIK